MNWAPPLRWVKRYKPVLSLVGVVWLAYLPLSCFQFALKNDAITDNFPNKYFFSTALHEGFLPQWNPYLNFGFPLNGDFGFAYYHPLTWFFGVLGYNPYSFTIEVLVYLSIAAVGMYRLLRWLLKNQPVAYLGGMLYACSGFFVGNMQHVNFLTGAAFLPFVVHEVLCLLRAPSFRASVKLSVAGYFLVACGHPAIPVATLYCLCLLCVLYFLSERISARAVAVRFLHLALAALLTAFFFLPALYSYYNILPQYALARQQLAVNPGAYLSPQSLFSFVFPLATNSNDIPWGNDISMRNCYISFSALCFLFFSFSKPGTAKQPYVFAATGVLMLLFAVDGSIRTFLFTRLPLLSHIRTNGEYRVFALFFLILSSCYGMVAFYRPAGFDQRCSAFKSRLNWLFLGLALLTAAFVLRNPQVLRLPVSSLSRGVLKEAIHALTPTKLLFYNCLMLAIIIIALRLSARNLHYLKWVVVGEMMLACWVCLPFTGVGETSLATANNVLKELPAGIPLPPLRPVANNDTFPTPILKLLGDASYYNKQIGVTRLTDYPSYFVSTETALESANASRFLNKPFIQLAKDSGSAALSLQRFTPNEVEISCTLTGRDTLVLLQNKTAHWHVAVDGEQATLNEAYHSFMSVPLAAGTHKVRYYYEDNVFVVLFVVCGLALLGTLVFLALAKPTHVEDLSAR